MVGWYVCVTPRGGAKTRASFLLPSHILICVFLSLAIRLWMEKRWDPGKKMALQSPINKWSTGRLKYRFVYKCSNVDGTNLFSRTRRGTSKERTLHTRSYPKILCEMDPHSIFPKKQTACGRCHFRPILTDSNNTVSCCLLFEAKSKMEWYCVWYQ